MQKLSSERRKKIVQELMKRYPKWSSKKDDPDTIEKINFDVNTVLHNELRRQKNHTRWLTNDTPVDEMLHDLRYQVMTGKRRS